MANPSAACSLDVERGEVGEGRLTGLVGTGEVALVGDGRLAGLVGVARSFIGEDRESLGTIRGGRLL